MGRATGKNNQNLGVLELLKGLFGTVGSAGRGLAAGTIGFPGDMESLGRMLIHGVDNEAFLPTTEKVAGALPQLPKGMRQPIAEELGKMGAMTPGQVTKLAKAAKAGGLELANRVMMPPQAIAQAEAEHLQHTKEAGDDALDFPSWLDEHYPDLLSYGPELYEGAVKPRVVQIYGKKNSTPKAEYLPMIQDLIKSNNFDVSEDMLKNAQLYPHSKHGYLTKEELGNMVKQIPYDSEALDLWQTHIIDNGDIKFAEGGLVEGDDFAYPGMF